VSQFYYAIAVLADTPVVYYKCDEPSGFLQDSSGNARHITGGTATSYQQAGPMVGAYAVSLTGPAAFTRSAAFLTAADNFTVEAWVNPAAYSAALMTFWQCNGSGCGLWVRNTGKFLANIFGGAAQADSAGTLSVNTWYHVALVRRAGTWEYYRNGSVDTANAGSGAPTMPATTLVVNYGNNPSIQARYSNLAWYHSALPAARIQAHYDAALRPDDPGGSGAGATAWWWWS
jgi:hypothetical protein